MRFQVRWGTLRTRIIAWSFVPTVIILVTVAVVILYAYRDVTEDLAAERNQQLTSLTTGHLSTRLQRYAEILSAEARRTAFSGVDEVRRDALKGAARRLTDFDGGVVILDTFGRVVALEPDRPNVVGQFWSNRPYYREMLRLEIDDLPRPLFSDVVHDGPDGAPVVAVAVPILDENGHFQGVMAGFFQVGASEIGTFYQQVLEPSFSDRESVYLVDGQGHVIYHSDPSQMGEDWSDSAVVGQLLDRETGAIRTRDLDGKEIVTSYSPVPGTLWGLVIEEDWAALLSSGLSYRRFLLVLLMLGIVLPALVVALGVRRITRPIEDLISAAQEVAEGNFGRKITAQTGDEIEALAEQFNLMSSHLEESYANLEQRVASRTTELAALNAIAVEVSQSLDLQEVLHSAVSKTLEVMEIESGGIYLLDEEAGELTIAAQEGLTPRLVVGIDHLRVGEGFSGRVIETGQPLVVHDLAQDPRLTRTVVEEEGFRTLVIVPLSVKGRVLGTLFAMTHEHREFTDQDVELLVSIGHQIGVAVESARLFRDEKRRAEQFRVINEVGGRLTSILDIDEVLVQIVGLAQRAFGYDHVGIALIEGDEAVYKVGAGQLWEDPDFDFRPRRLKIGQEGITGWVAGSGKPLLVPDVSQEPRYVSMQGSQTRSELAVPITIKRNVVGVLDVQSDRLRAMDDSDLVVLQSLAHQAAVAIENARLFDAEQRRTEQFRVLSEVGRHLTSILDVDELLDEVTYLVKDAFDYYGVGIGLVEDDVVVYKSGAGAFWEVTKLGGSLRLKIGEEGLTGLVAATGEPYLAPDVSKEPRFYYVPELGETRSEICVPLKAKGCVIGVLCAQGDHINAFDDSDLEVLQALANQAAIAIDNAVLFDAEQRRAEQFRVINEVGRHFTSILPVEDLLAQMARLIQEALDYYHVGIGLIEGDGVVSIAEAGELTGRSAGLRLRIGQEGVWARVARAGEPVLTPDVRQEPQYRYVPEANEIRSQICVPLKTKDAIIGVLSAESDRLNAFDQSDLAVLQSLAQQAALSIENARLYEQAQQLAVLEERQRLARELHDAVTQTLFSASLIAEALPDIWEADQEEGRDLLRDLRQLSRGALAEMRTLLLELRPAALMEANLGDLLFQLGEAVTGRIGIPVDVSVEGSCSFPSDVHVALYRIAQEALNNVVKHAGASQVQVRLCCACMPAGIDRMQRQEVELLVVDDGRGFDSRDVPPDRLGLGIIRERAQDIGAGLDIVSALGRGTRIRTIWKGEV